MKIDMGKIDEWLDEAIISFVLSRPNRRCQESDLYLWFNPLENTHLHAGMVSGHPEWMALSRQKRQNRIRKTLDKMLREHRIEIRNESGDPDYSEGYTRYIYEIEVLDRIVAHLEDDDD